jgi:hypothetical protein
VYYDVLMMMILLSLFAYLDNYLAMLGTKRCVCKNKSKSLSVEPGPLSIRKRSLSPFPFQK